MITPRQNAFWWTAGRARETPVAQASLDVFAVINPLDLGDAASWAVTFTAKV